MDYYFEKRDKISNKLLIVNGVILLLITLMIFLIYGETHKKKPVVSLPETITPSPFDNLDLGAKAAFVYDVLEKKVLYKKNEFIQLPLASLTKLMMAETALELLPKDANITIRPEFLREEGDTGLSPDESWKLKDLLDYSLVVSSNDGARSIASVVGAINGNKDNFDLGRKEFILKMNERAKALGLKQTYFVNETGLDIDNVSGGYGSAIDVATLMQYMLLNEPDVLESTKYATITERSSSEVHVGKNTNIDVGKIPGLLASKTGYTDMAGGNLAIAFDSSIGHPIIAVVLGSSLEGRFDDISKLVKASFAYAQGDAQINVGSTSQVKSPEASQNLSKK